MLTDTELESLITDAVVKHYVESERRGEIADYIHYHNGDTRLEGLLAYMQDFAPELLNSDFIDWETVATYFDQKNGEII